MRRKKKKKKTSDPDPKVVAARAVRTLPSDLVTGWALSTAATVRTPRIHLRVYACVCVRACGHGVPGESFRVLSRLVKHTHAYQKRRRRLFRYEYRFRVRKNRNGERIRKRKKKNDETFVYTHTYLCRGICGVLNSAQRHRVTRITAIKAKEKKKKPNELVVVPNETSAFEFESEKDRKIVSDTVIRVYSRQTDEKNSRSCGGSARKTGKRATVVCDARSSAIPSVVFSGALLPGFPDVVVAVAVGCRSIIPRPRPSPLTARPRRRPRPLRGASRDRGRSGGVCVCVGGGVGHIRRARSGGTRAPRRACSRRGGGRGREARAIRVY